MSKNSMLQRACGACV